MLTIDGRKPPGQQVTFEGPGTENGIDGYRGPVDLITEKPNGDVVRLVIVDCLVTDEGSVGLSDAKPIEFATIKGTIGVDPDSHFFLFMKPPA